MAKQLDVDTGGLRSAAASSGQVAEDVLAGGASFGGPTSARPSGAGIAAMDAATMAVRTRQAARISGQAADLSVAGARYDDTDGGSAEAIGSVSV